MRRPTLTPLRPPDPGEKFLSRYVLRPVVWFAFQFTSDGRMMADSLRKGSRADRWLGQR
jgi:hypothetical protein